MGIMNLAGYAKHSPEQRRQWHVDQVALLEKTGEMRSALFYSKGYIAGLDGEAPAVVLLKELHGQKADDADAFNLGHHDALLYLEQRSN